MEVPRDGRPVGWQELAQSGEVDRRSPHQHVPGALLELEPERDHVRADLHQRIAYGREVRLAPERAGDGEGRALGLREDARLLDARVAQVERVTLAEHRVRASGSRHDQVSGADEKIRHVDVRVRSVQFTADELDFELAARSAGDFLREREARAQRREIRAEFTLRRNLERRSTEARERDLGIAQLAEPRHIEACAERPRAVERYPARPARILDHPRSYLDARGIDRDAVDGEREARGRRGGLRALRVGGRLRLRPRSFGPRQDRLSGPVERNVNLWPVDLDRTQHDLAREQRQDRDAQTQLRDLGKRRIPGLGSGDADVTHSHRGQRKERERDPAQ